MAQHPRAERFDVRIAPAATTFRRGELGPQLVGGDERVLALERVDDASREHRETSVDGARGKRPRPYPGPPPARPRPASPVRQRPPRPDEHSAERQSRMRHPYSVFCWTQKKP